MERSNRGTVSVSSWLFASGLAVTVTGCGVCGGERWFSRSVDPFYRPGCNSCADAPQPLRHALARLPFSLGPAHCESVPCSNTTPAGKTPATSPAKSSGQAAAAIPTPAPRQPLADLTADEHQNATASAVPAAPGDQAAQPELETAAPSTIAANEPSAAGASPSETLLDSKADAELGDPPAGRDWFADHSPEVRTPAEGSDFAAASPESSAAPASESLSDSTPLTLDSNPAPSAEAAAESADQSSPSAEQQPSDQQPEATEDPAWTTDPEHNPPPFNGELTLKARVEDPSRVSESRLRILPENFGEVTWRAPTPAPESPHYLKKTEVARQGDLDLSWNGGVWGYRPLPSAPNFSAAAAVEETIEFAPLPIDIRPVVNTANQTLEMDPVLAGRPFDQGSAAAEGTAPATAQVVAPALDTNPATAARPIKTTSERR